VDQNQRHKRLRLLISKINKERKKQAKKIDILCNDFIAAQRDFIERLNTINFSADFYESIMGSADLCGLLYTASKLIRERVAEANVSFFLRQAESFELHMFENHEPVTVEKQCLENYFSPELVDNICQSNKLCTIDDLFAMGIEGNLNELSKISVVTVPLGLFGSSLGFILIYRISEDKITDEEIKDVCAITCGLSRAIASCQELLHSVE